MSEIKGFCNLQLSILQGTVYIKNKDILKCVGQIGRAEGNIAIIENSIIGNDNNIKKSNILADRIIRLTKTMKFKPKAEGYKSDIYKKLKKKKIKHCTKN